MEYVRILLKEFQNNALTAKPVNEAEQDKPMQKKYRILSLHNGKIVHYYQKNNVKMWILLIEFHKKTF